MSSSFLAALKNWPSASNASAAVARCSGVKLLLTPNQVNETRTAAMVVRSRWAAVVVVAVSVRVSARSRRLVLMGNISRMQGTKGGGRLVKGRTPRRVASSRLKTDRARTTWVRTAIGPRSPWLQRAAPSSSRNRVRASHPCEPVGT